MRFAVILGASLLFFSIAGAKSKSSPQAEVGMVRFFTLVNPGDSSLNDYWRDQSLVSFVRDLDELQGQVDWIRLHFFFWDLYVNEEQTDFSAEPRFHLQKLEFLKKGVELAKKRGFKVQVASADPNPRFVSRFTGRLGTCYDNQQVKELQPSGATQAEVQAYYRRSMAVLAREFANVDSWHLFNEGNQFDWRQTRCGQDVMDQEGYLEGLAELAVIARGELKKTNPDTVIVSSPFIMWRDPELPELDALNPVRLLRYWSALWGQEGSDKTLRAVDALGLNLYPKLIANQDPQRSLRDSLAQQYDDYDKVFAILRQRYAEAPIWIGEFGVPVSGTISAEERRDVFRESLTRVARAADHVMVYAYNSAVGATGVGLNGYGFKNYKNEKDPYYADLIQTLQSVRPQPATHLPQEGVQCQQAYDSAECGSIGKGLEIGLKGESCVEVSRPHWQVKYGLWVSCGAPGAVLL